MSLVAALCIAASCSSAGRGTSPRVKRAPIFENRQQPVPERERAAQTEQAEQAAHREGFPQTGQAVLPDSISGGLPAITDSPGRDTACLRPFDFRLPDGDSLEMAQLTSGDDSVRRQLLALIPDSLLGAHPDTLRAIAARHGIDIPEGMDFPGPGASPENRYAAADTAILPMPYGGMPAGEEEPAKAFLEAPVVGKARDSLIYDVRNRLVFVYGQGDLTYEENNLKADHMILNVATKEIFGVGQMDTATGLPTRPEFLQGSAAYTMDTITYNLDSKKAKIKGVATQDGEGFLLGRDLKKMPDNTVNIYQAKYTTCDRVEHPHFYIAMTKAKVIPGKKIITGPAYFVMEDVPIYFLGIPGGFFPISTGPQSGFIMPTYGEEATRGFYLRDGGYYFTFGDYADLALTGAIYTLGSWDVNARTNYIKRYKYSGNLAATYARTVVGEKNSSSYQNSGNLRLQWSHRMDPKARPGTMFSASVNFATAGYNKQATTTLNDHLNTQTNSSISYSRSWMVGSTSINLTASFNHSSNSRDSTISLTLPNISFSVGSFSPFKRKVQIGKQRWYEKITVSYSMTAQNATGSNTKERDLFSRHTLENLQNGVRHSIPIKTSFNFWGFVSFSPSFNYNEVWNFKRQFRMWDPYRGSGGAVVENDPEFGFFRTYAFDVNGSFSTKLYGMFQPKRKPGKDGWLQAVRHVMTPTVGFTYSPDFTHPRFGMQQYYQRDSLGTIASYNPNKGNPTMSAVPARASLNFSLSNQLEMKVRSKRDSTGLKKIPIIEQLSASGSYDFLKDSMQLSTISLTLRSGQIFKNFAIQLNAVWDPYQVVVDSRGTVIPIRKFNVGGGNFGRIASTGWSFGYTFNSSNSSQPAMNDITSGAFVGAYTNPFDPDLNLDPATRRQYMVSSYYDFSIPWNFGFNYSVNYTNNGVRKNIIQTFGFNGSVTLTPKWGVTFNGGIDLNKWQFTPMSVNVVRDLHCWSMTFQWIPIGQMKSYQFHIGIKSGMLADIKYDKQSSHFDNLLE